MDVVSNNVNATINFERKRYEDIKDELADCKPVIYPIRSTNTVRAIVATLKRIEEKYKEIDLTGAIITSKDGIPVSYTNGSIRRSDSLLSGSFWTKP